jgi:DNA-binding CsgD family transcriptional regulator
VVSRIPGGSDRGTAVVVDDAHLLADSEVHRLIELADDPDRTVVVATEARDHDPARVGLRSTLEREHPRIFLGPLPIGDVARVLADPSGHPPSTELLEVAMAATGSIPLLVSAVSASAHPLTATTMNRAVGYALNERLRRLDPRDLETLLIATLSTDLAAADVAAALELTGEHAAELVDRTRSTGLVEPSHSATFLRAVHRAAAQIVGAARHHDVEIAVLRTQLSSATLSDHLALELAEHGVRHDDLAHWLREHTPGSDADTDTRIRWYRAAVDAGAVEVRIELADALALGGQCASAATLADQLLVSPDKADRASGTRIAASVATHDGNTAYAAELFSWLGAYPDATIGSAAALAHTAMGDLTAARGALEAAHSGPPTTAARAARSLAEGLLLTIDGPFHAAAARLGQAVAGEHAVAALVMPDSAPAVVTLSAVHAGDSVRARSVIGRAVRASSDAVFTARHRLLQGWVQMQDGQLASAASAADAVHDLHGRDALWVAALRTAIARRGGDAGALATHWFAGMDVLAEYSVDLFCLLPLGELWMAAARLRQQERLAPTVEQAFALLAALGRPPAWSALLHWAGVHAGILAGDPAAVAPHGQALAAMADQSKLAAALAAAGRTWLQVLANQAGPDDVIAAARGLSGFGLTSDATRLAGQAALQAPDPKVSALMLQVARDLKIGIGEGPSEFPDAAPHSARPAATALSDREREVAELLLLGMPYRDIGAQLFISAKTVEHHVARIRRRLGAESRSEMLSMLRAILGANI